MEPREALSLDPRGLHPSRPASTSQPLKPNAVLNLVLLVPAHCRLLTQAKPVKERTWRCY